MQSAHPNPWGPSSSNPFTDSFGVEDKPSSFNDFDPWNSEAKPSSAKGRSDSKASTPDDKMSDPPRRGSNSSSRNVGRKVVRRSVLRLSEVDDAWRDKVNMPDEKKDRDEEDQRPPYHANPTSPTGAARRNRRGREKADDFDSLFDAEKQSSSNPFQPPPLERHHSTDSLGGSPEKPGRDRLNTWNHGDGNGGNGQDSDPFDDDGWGGKPEQPRRKKLSLGDVNDQPEKYQSRRKKDHRGRSDSQEKSNRPVRRRRTSQDLEDEDEQMSPKHREDMSLRHRKGPREDHGEKKESWEATKSESGGGSKQISASAPSTPQQRRPNAQFEVVRHGSRRRGKKRRGKRNRGGNDTDNSESESGWESARSADEYSGAEDQSYAGSLRPYNRRALNTDRPRRASASANYKKPRTRTRYKLTGKYPNGVLTLSLVKETVLKADDEFWDNRVLEAGAKRKGLNPIDLLHNGISILKYGKRGFPHFKHLQLSKANDCIQWFSKKKDISATTIYMKDIRALTQGQTTGNFQRVDWKSLAPTSFSIIYGKTRRKRITLDVVCKSSDEASLWTMALQEIVDRMKAGEQEADIKSLKCLPVWQQCFKTKKTRRRRYKEITDEQKERVQIEFHSLSQNLDSCSELIEKNPQLEDNVEWDTIMHALDQAKSRERDFAVAIKDGDMVYETDVWRANLDICVLKEKVEVVIRMLKKKSGRSKRFGRSKRKAKKDGSDKSKSLIRNAEAGGYTSVSETEGDGYESAATNLTDAPME